jgi:OmpA-OmpF porin, OOP family
MMICIVFDAYTMKPDSYNFQIKYLKKMKKLSLLLTLVLFAQCTFAQMGASPTFKAYSNFDFVSGEKVIAIEDFMQDSIGDFPARWNTNGSGEIVTIGNYEGRWLQINNGTTVFPEFVTGLPENFTLEFTITANATFKYASHWLSLVFTPTTEPRKLFGYNFPSKIEVAFTPLAEQGKSSIDIWDATSKSIITNLTSSNKFSLPQKPMVKVSVWRQKARLRVYLDDEKIWDIPRAFEPSVVYKKIVFSGSNGLQTEKRPFYISGFRFAVGVPDTRNKLITEGKFVTTGILFDKNADQIKRESYGTLKQIAQVLQENPEAKVKIIGHTDSDGEDAQNLDLSKRRAAAVKANLSSEFGIEANRLQIDGKGESQPAAPNTNPEGKANNRRVEFIKL